MSYPPLVSPMWTPAAMRAPTTRRALLVFVPLFASESEILPLNGAGLERKLNVSSKKKKERIAV